MWFQPDATHACFSVTGFRELERWAGVTGLGAGWIDPSSTLYLRGSHLVQPAVTRGLTLPGAGIPFHPEGLGDPGGSGPHPQGPGGLAGVTQEAGRFAREPSSPARALGLLPACPALSPLGRVGDGMVRGACWVGLVLLQRPPLAPSPSPQSLEWPRACFWLGAPSRP